MATEIISKRCFKCKEIKPFSEFYRAKNCKDGYRYECIKCNNDYNKKYRKTNNGKIAQKRYSQSGKGKVVQKRYRQSEKCKATQKRYLKSEKGKACRKSYYLSCDKNKYRARSAVAYAIENSKLPKADSMKCSCGKPAKEYHHYLGYAPEHYLDVIPVCIKCHSKL
jgi:hypothetical protein